MVPASWGPLAGGRTATHRSESQPPKGTASMYTTMLAVCTSSACTGNARVLWGRVCGCVGADVKVNTHAGNARVRGGTPPPVAFPPLSPRLRRGGATPRATRPQAPR